jgi:hypothetical protein
LAVVGVLFLAEVAAVRQFFASEVGGVADFHSRWYGARALLLEGRDPYSPEVTAEIVAIRDPEGRQTNSFSSCLWRCSVSPVTNTGRRSSECSVL